ncbi:hypothetical protein DH2020_008103 [Rehmannia glutinosa]|uniref:FBD domain-containing protein n=1 Tax=Rehmannia glutinosa TaxID=99300 RepID=A0ABR0U010_REHGL
MDITRQSSGNMPSVDRISSLTDGVLCHILSFLPTKISVATSILARRWRFLWAYVPSLDFDCRNHDTDTKFAHIVNRVLLLRGVQSIITFRLRYDDIDCSDCLLPQCLFTCKTLVDLRLHFRNCIPSNGVVSLPSLKKLHIYGVENGLRRMLSGCPVLEELIIDQIDEDDLDFYDVIISSPTITRLIMISFQIYSDESYSREYGVKINVPALRYLQVEGCLSKEISAQLTTSLTEANISFKKDNEILREDYFVDKTYNEMEEGYSSFELNFVDSLCNVKSLKLSSGKRFSVEEFRGQSKSIIRFDHLTRLDLAVDWLFLTKFFERADNLQVLIIREVDARLKCWMEEPKQVPKCLLSHLGTVRIYQFECAEDEFKLVRYILRNAQVLKRMEIHFKCYDICLKTNAIQRIFLFERGSEACELAFK